MKGNGRARTSTIPVLLSAWTFPAFAEGTAAADPAADTTQEPAGEQAQTEPDEDNDSETDPGADEPVVGKDDGADGGKAEPDQPLTLGTSGIVASSATVSGTEVTVRLDNPGDLEADLLALSATITANQITKLTVIGDINGSDLDFIWDDGVGVMTSLEVLDLSSATYVEPGGRLKAVQFRSNTYLKTIALPSGITYIENDAFHTCTALESIDFSNCTGLTDIAMSAFENCTSLMRVNLSACVSLTKIDENAFKNCSSLASLYFPDNLTDITEYSFRNCTALTSVRFPSALISIGSYAFDGSFQGSPATVDLSGCASLTTISARAFFNCNRLTDVVLPAGLTTIGQGAFAGSGIVRADWSDLVNLATLSQEAFMGCGDLIYADLTGTGIASIETNTFYGCTSLETVYLPNSMTVIAGSTFQYCNSLRSVTMPAGLTAISDNTFDGCDSLEVVDLRRCADLTAIGDRAFIGCAALEYVDLSGCTSLTSIGSNSFDGCTGLKLVQLPDTGGMIGVDSTTFTGCSNVMVIVPTALHGSYQNAPGWSACVSAGEVILIGGYTVTVNQAAGGFVDVSTRIGAQGDTIVLEVTEYPGYTHTGWSNSPGNLNLLPITNNAYRFVLPAQDVTITPVYKSGGTTNPVPDPANRGSALGGRATSGDNAIKTAATANKIQIPASAFSWDGVATTAYSVHSGSIVIRFDREWIDSQAAGSHTIRVEFLNHTGETTVNLTGKAGEGNGGAGNSGGNANHNPQTGA